MTEVLTDNDIENSIKVLVTCERVYNSTIKLLDDLGITVIVDEQGFRWHRRAVVEKQTRISSDIVGTTT